MADVHDVNTAKRSIFVALPSLDGKPEALTTSSLCQAIMTCQQMGWDITIKLHLGDSMLHRARNILLGQFLKGDFTDFFALDADIGFSANEFVRLMNHPVDFVAGCYRTKTDNEHYPVKWPDGKISGDQKLGLLEAENVPFGFVRLTRACVEKMQEAYKDQHFVPHDFPDVDCWRIFAFDEDFGEDYVFCRRWRELGGKVWVDPYLTLLHAGKKFYEGNLARYLSAQHQAATAKAPAAQATKEQLENLVHTIAVALDKQKTAA